MHPCTLPLDLPLPEIDGLPEKLQITSDIMLDSFIILSLAFFYEKGEFDIESRVTFKVISQCTPSIYNKDKNSNKTKYLECCD